MKVKIKLKNPKHCNGCPLSWEEEALDNESGDRFLGRVCQLGYWTEKSKERDYINVYIKGLFSRVDENTGKPWDSKNDPYMLQTKCLINRPEKCIKENGK